MLGGGRRVYKIETELCHEGFGVSSQWALGLSWVEFNGNSINNLLAMKTYDSQTYDFQL